jgi:hypothetical protein
VFCFKIFKLASELIRHVEDNHKGETGRRATFMQATLDEIRGRITNELNIAKTTYQSTHMSNKSKKRTWDAAEIEPVASTGTAVLGKEYSLTGIAQLHTKTGATALHSSAQIAPNFTPMPSISQTAASVDEDSIHSAQLIYSSSLGAATQRDHYNARLLEMVSSVPYTGDFGWTSETSGWEAQITSHEQQ